MGIITENCNNNNLTVIFFDPFCLPYSYFATKQPRASSDGNAWKQTGVPSTKTEWMNVPPLDDGTLMGARRGIQDL